MIRAKHFPFVVFFSVLLSLFTSVRTDAQEEEILEANKRTIHRIYDVNVHLRDDHYDGYWIPIQGNTPDNQIFSAVNEKGDNFSITCNQGVCPVYHYGWEPNLNIDNGYVFS